MTVENIQGNAPNPDHVSQESYQHLFTLSGMQRKVHYRYLLKANRSDKNDEVISRVLR